MIDFTEKPRYGFEDLVELVRLLRGPGGCPWDGAQTHESIRRNFLEEALEACEAIDEQDPAHLAEELGDVLLQVVFHAGIETDAGRFTVDDVCDAVCRKLIRRHPQLFGGAGQQLGWEDLKRVQRGNQTVAQAMSGVSGALPAAWQADKILSKAEASGLYRPDGPAIRRELELALAAFDRADAPDAGAGWGRAAFALLELARLRGVDAEAELTRQCRQFISGFSRREAAAAEAAQKERKEVTP